LGSTNRLCHYDGRSLSTCTSSAIRKSRRRSI